MATALPPYRVGQDEARDFARALFGGAHQNIERLLSVFDNTQIQTRHFCVPTEWFSQEHTFPEKNDLYVKHAMNLSEEAARRALDRAGVEPTEIGAIFFVSTTGLSTPSIGSKLIFRLGLSEHTRRVPIWGLGCAGGASGLASAAEHVRANPRQPVLLVAVELCGLTFQPGDLSKANLISTSLFADGAAALVVGEGEGPEVLGGHSTTWPETEDVMGWNIVETGFEVQILGTIPNIARERMGEDFRTASESLGLRMEDLEHFVLHPGGAKVLAAFEEVLGLESGGLPLSWEILGECGNMSSPTVFFVLERFLQRGEYEEGDLGVMTAMGPGFSAEHVFFRC